MKKVLLLILCFITLTISAQNIALDISYGTNGYTTFDSRSTDHFSFSQLLSSGSLLVSSSRFNTTTNKKEPILVKYTPQGNIDASFATNGFYIINSNDDNGVAVFIDSDENIYLFDNSENSKLLKLTPNGVLNNSFGTNGVISIDTPINFLASINNNDFLASGILKDGTYKLIKFNSNGLVDSSFGNNGELLYTDYEVTFTTLKQIDSEIYLALSVETNSKYTKLFKYDSTGNLVTSFGNNGILLLKNDAIVSSIEKYDNKLYLLGIEIPNIKIKISSYDFNGVSNNSFSKNGTFVGNIEKELPLKIYSRNDDFIIVGKRKNSNTDVKILSTKYNLSNATVSVDDITNLNITSSIQ